MARRSQHSFLKRQKEMKRKESAAEKMARRQGKKDRSDEDVDGEEQILDHENDGADSTESET